MTAVEYSEEAGINPQNASSTMRRLVKIGLVKESTVVRPDARGRRQRVPFYTLKNEQLKLPTPGLPVGTKRERRGVTPWEELTPAQQAARVASREYYRRQQAEKGRIVKPRLGDDEGYRYGQRGSKKRSMLLAESSRLAEAASILFPNGLRTDENFFAWVDLTRELMNG